MIESFKTVLVLAPHTDDGEFGAGGTVARLLEAGATVHYVAFSICEESVPAGYPSDILKHELAKATSTLGIDQDKVIALSYRVRRFPAARQEILENLVRYRNEIKPDLVLLPMRSDVHQDHSVITNEGIRAFKGTSILGYELIWNNLSTQNTSFVELEEAHLAKKIDALHQYETQHHRPYSSKEFIRSLATVRGVQSGTGLAEVFEVIRLISKL